MDRRVLLTMALVSCGAAGTPCAELGAAWGGGRATRAGDRWDTRACEASGLIEMVKPAERDPSRWATARCNDGTPFGLTVRLAPGSRDWVLYLQGGGPCEGEAMPCTERSPALATTPDAPDRGPARLRAQALLDPDPSANPDFAGANAVWAWYCSSDLWMGDGTDRRPIDADPDGWYFSGRANVSAMVEVLVDRYGLDDTDPATRVLFAGGSAGGMGVLANGDAVARQLPETTARGALKLLDDAGFPPAFDHPSFRIGASTRADADVMARAWEVWGAGHEPHCVADRLAAGEPPSRCMLGEVVAPYLLRSWPDRPALPLLVQQCLHDQWSTTHHGITADHPEHEAGLAAWTAASERALADLPWLYARDEPAYHTLANQADRWDRGPAGESFRDVLGAFWRDEAPRRVVVRR